MIDTSKAVREIMSRRQMGNGQARHLPKGDFNPSDEFEPKHLAASEMIEAFHAKDHKKLAHALSSFLDMHKMESHPEEDFPAES